MSLLTTLVEYLNPFNSPSLEGTLIREETEQGNAYFVYLPPAYDDSQNYKIYPILYHLHGAGSPEFVTKKDIAWTAKQNEIYERFPMIVVAPIGASFSMWADGKESLSCKMVMEDVMPFVEKKYQVDTSRRFIQGFSMGGFGAATWAFKFPGKFRKVILWDGALHDFDTLSRNRASIAQHQFDNNPELFEPWSPWEMTSKASANNTLQQTPILMYAGSMEATRSMGGRFAVHLHELRANYKYTETEFPHVLKPFVEKYGYEAFAFLANDSD